MVTGDRTRLAAAIGALMHAALRERGEPSVVVVECSTLSDSNHTWAIVAIGDEAQAKTLATAGNAPPSSFDEWRGGLGLALPAAPQVVPAVGPEGGLHLVARQRRLGMA